MKSIKVLTEIIEKNQRKLNDASEEIRILRDYDPLINTDLHMTPYEIERSISKCNKTILKCRKRISHAKTQLKAVEPTAVTYAS